MVPRHIADEPLVEGMGQQYLRRQQTYSHHVRPRRLD